MKTLILIRHAKSSWADATLDDFDRPLNDRGKRDAPRIGAFLKAKGIAPELIIASPAKRAFTTAKKIAKAIDFPKEQIIQEPSFYHFGYRGTPILIRLAKVEDAINQVMIFGHNPTFTGLANHLSGHYFDNVPTCGVVAITFDVEKWKDIDGQNGRLWFHQFPKLLP